MALSDLEVKQFTQINCHSWNKQPQNCCAALFFPQRLWQVVLQWSYPDKLVCLRDWAGNCVWVKLFKIATSKLKFRARSERAPGSRNDVETAEQLRSECEACFINSLTNTHTEQNNKKVVPELSGVFLDKQTHHTVQHMSCNSNWTHYMFLCCKMLKKSWKQILVMGLMDNLPFFWQRGAAFIPPLE